MKMRVVASECRFARPDPLFFDPLFFINAEAYSEKVLRAQAGIHIAFLISAMAIAACDRILVGAAKGSDAH